MALIDLDHAATTPVKRAVLEAMLPYFGERYANASGGYAGARASREAIDRARAQVAGAIGAKSGEILFTSGGTEADNWAILGGALATRGNGKRRVVTTKIEHHAVLRACEALERLGFEVVYAGVDGEGRVDPEEFRALITPDTALVSVMLANNEVGTIQPVARIAQIAHQNGALMHTDAVQAVGHIPVDVDALGVDLLSMAAHKFYGPKGIGALYVRAGTRLERMMLGGEQERGMRAGTENTPAIVGMAKALALAVDEMTETSQRVSELRDALIEGLLSRIPGIVLNGSRSGRPAGEGRLPGNVHVTIPGADARTLLLRLDMEGVAASSGSACASGASERSHVLTAMRAIEGADLRLTLGEDNDMEDVRRVIDALCRILRV